MDDNSLDGVHQSIQDSNHLPNGHSNQNQNQNSILTPQQQQQYSSTLAAAAVAYSPTAQDLLETASDLYRRIEADPRESLMMTLIGLLYPLI